MTRTTKWSAGTAVLVTVVLLAGWLLLLSPQRSQAADLREQAAAEQVRAGALLGRIAELRAQDTELPAKQALLETLRAQIPADVDLPGLVRALTAAADTAGVELQAVAPSPPRALTAAEIAAAAAAGADPQQISAVPVTVTVGGEFAETERFLFELEGLTRSFLVTGLTEARSAGDASTSASASETSLEGPLTLTVLGQVFIAAGAPLDPAPATTPVASATPAATPSATPTATPTATSTATPTP